MLLKKKISKIIALFLMSGLLVTAIWLGTVSADAAGRFPGIDILISQNVQSPFSILEIVEEKEDASIGFYFKENEPFGIDEDALAISFDEMIVAQEDASARQTYVNGLLTRLEGMYYDTSSTTQTGAQEDYPLVYTAYDETYFVESNDTSVWKEVELESNEYVSINGSYVATGTDADGNQIYGNYMKNDDAYSVAMNGKGNYVENIGAFTAEATNKMYNVTFTTDENAQYSNLGAYLPVYDSDGTTILSYFYDGATKDPESTAVYYYVADYEFSYDYDANISTGTYGAILKNGEEPFVSCTEGEGTHNKDEESYSLLEGLGEYDFVIDSTKPECEVEVDAYYYKGGFKNNSWFVEKVFSLNQASSGLNVFSTVVRTVTVDELRPEMFEGMNMVVFNGTDASAFADINESAMKALVYKIEAATFPCMINSELMQGVTADTSILYAYMNEFNTLGATDADLNYVNESVYWHTGDIFNLNLGTLFTEAQEAGFEEISQYIEEENKYLELNGIEADKMLDDDLSQAVAIQYVLSRQSARNITNKEQLTILEIEPCADYFFKDETNSNTKYDKVRALTGYSATDMPNDNITIVQMTTSEFIGKIEDLNGTYDFIYIGMQTGLMNVDANGETVYNDATMNGYVYTHTGDAVITTERLAGLLDTDYIGNDRNNYLYSKEVYNLRHEFGEDGKLVITPQDVLYNARTSAGTQTQMVSVGTVGAYRYSGNDITEEKMEDLMEYINAGYPIILDQDFYKVEQDENAAEVRAINDAKVDNSSYLYEFLGNAWNKPNLFFYEDIVSTSESNTTAENFSFYMAIPKLEINFDIVENGKPANYLEGNYVEADEDGNYYLSYTFMISDEAAALPTETDYTAALYVDLNSDGKYSRLAEQLDDAIVTEFGTGASVEADELKAGTAYVLKRQIPDSFRSVVPWKLEVSQTGKELIRKSEIGYAGIEITGAKEEIKVLQIKDSSANTWDIGNDQQFADLMEEVKDFTIDVDSVTVYGYEQQTSKATYSEYLNEYDMLIIGFADVYGEFENYDAVNAILQYINSGKSVLFTHDTTSFTNYDGNKYNEVNGNIATMGQSRWGYLFNTWIRNAVGMDRYGVTATDDAGAVLRQGNILNKVTEDGADITNATDPYSVVEKSGKDMAYVAGSNRTQTYPEVEGYVYLTLNLAKNELGENENHAETYEEVAITNISTSGQDNNYPASNAIDKNNSTYWKDNVADEIEAIYPYVGIELRQSRSAGTQYTFFYTPRNDRNNGSLHSGYVEVSGNGSDWTKVADISRSDNYNMSYVKFTSPISFKYVRLVYTESYGSPINRYASAKRIGLGSGNYNGSGYIDYYQTNSAFTNTYNSNNESANNVRYDNNIWHSSYGGGYYEAGIDPSVGFPWAAGDYNIDLTVGSQEAGDYVVDYYPYSGATEGNIVNGKVYVKSRTSWNEVESFSWDADDSKKTVSFTSQYDFTQIRIKVISTSSATTANLNKEVNAAEFKVQKVDNSGLVLGTHSEYYNLSTDSGVNSMSGGNGAFSNTVVTAVNSGQITNYPFAIPEKFNVSSTHSQYYQLDLEADKDQDGESDIVVWYCISDANNDAQDLYSASPNDVRNNYYIYSIGNVFYSGVGHSNVSSSEEKKLFINTMIAAYSAQISNPTVTSLAKEDMASQEAKTVRLPIEFSLKDDVNNANGYLDNSPVTFYYSVYDANFVSGSIGSGNEKDIVVKYYLKSNAEGASVIPNLENGTVTGIDITDEVVTTHGGTAITDQKVESGKAYTATWTPTDMTLAEYMGDNESISIYIQVSSTFDYYGSPKTQYGHDEIFIKKTNLFGLD